MNVTEASKKIAEQISLKTYEKVMKYLQEWEEPDSGIARAKEVTENCFKQLLTCHFETDFDRSERDFPQAALNIRDALMEADMPDQWEELRGELLNIYTTGYLTGYVYAVKDAERLLYSLDDHQGNGETDSKIYENNGSQDSQ